MTVTSCYSESRAWGPRLLSSWISTDDPAFVESEPNKENSLGTATRVADCLRARVPHPSPTPLAAPHPKALAFFLGLFFGTSDVSAHGAIGRAPQLQREVEKF
jgi:hypothetical protein